ncbi:MAG: ATP-binding protein [Bryobacteraceae bacterium]|nr:ATP-binding protein [Bryobacteraceae bacterium]MDW8380311.1 ATP-binding protein [Bryobacterales bacterium]
MRKRILFGSGLVALAILLALNVWQSSFSLGAFRPSDQVQTYVYWGVSTLIFILTVTLGFMLFRTGLKLYVERQRNREGSRIRSRLVVGALGLSFMPVLFLVVFSVSILNFNLNSWFSRPAEKMKWSLIEVGVAMDQEAQARAKILARLLASQPFPKDIETLCIEQRIEQGWVEDAKGQRTYFCGHHRNASRRSVEGRAQQGPDSQVVIRLLMPVDFDEKHQEIQKQVADYARVGEERKHFRKFYLLLLSLITLFILFVATWIAQFMARQISDPISAILEAADRVRRGDLSYRLNVSALDELGTLVRAFNQMTQDLEANSRELDQRRRFTEAILESIPTAVISLSPDGHIQHLNHALEAIFPDVRKEELSRIEDILPPDEAREIRYLMKRAQRTGVAARQIDFQRGKQTIHLSVTVAALEDTPTAGFVLLMEDTSELLRAQKAAAWHEVARRIAHEIKNPLTPIALCAERVARQLDRLGIPPESSRILRECCATILSEVESVKTLVDEFSQFARFPAAQPAPCDLNEIVENALAVFQGRLDHIEIRKHLAPKLPLANLDREQIKRVVVNLVDNAAEAMQDSPIKRLTVTTQLASDSIEMIIADTGSGVSAEDREKLFLPYFSTKGRGTGLGLAIVNQILSEHRASIRVEDNKPSGARFIVEFPVASSPDVELSVVEARA